jgi:hypothetical protein
METDIETVNVTVPSLVTNTNDWQVVWSIVGDLLKLPYVQLCMANVVNMNRNPSSKRAAIGILRHLWNVAPFLRPLIWQMGVMVKGCVDAQRTMRVSNAIDK